MNTKQVTPNRLDEAKEFAKGKDLSLPETIDAAEAKLMHIASIQSTPDFANSTFKHTLQIIKVPVESYKAIEPSLNRIKGSIVILHDGQRFAAENPGFKVDDETPIAASANATETGNAAKMDVVGAKTETGKDDGKNKAEAKAKDETK